MLDRIKESADFIKVQIDFTPQFGIILGTGLGGLVKEIDIAFTLDYDKIPNFPVSTVESHAGRLVFGELGGKKVVAMQGRFHYYEGYSFQEITFPVRVFKFLGIDKLFVSNACGSVNPKMKTCDLMIINDHINLLGGNPLRGKNINELGPRFPDMAEPYDKGMINKAQQIVENGDFGDITVHTGVYASVQGPNLETRAEYKYIQIIGADVVGMSTIPEVLVARHMGIPCFAISVITDEGFHDELEEVSVEDVISAANKSEPYMTKIIRELITGMN
ncbi:MAG: purine-nucleoside phosphorylase [Bacteroidetes bacterium]|jgi:purine-nucleoside phosphorylase|nr:purine-nucleoside phosphorylase [Bacteroidota bacterium]MBT5528158.1 purine-nucleoside phosphorylase [Cytophagia bacterium]MBT3424723.1 purine-nucleoside phosphorylase [Bacteroidota bacterium]MBT3799858.1 purine-nucleoside phosphorylase [Bacteroidota bacterium]MBT3935522.1 purine-nucleoside phosphorylase [Bacteroidota bacterium]